MGSLDFEPLHPNFGARVRGVSLVGEIADETVEEIKKAIDAYSLLCFPDQPMNDEAQIAFTRIPVSYTHLTLPTILLV